MINKWVESHTSKKILDHEHTENKYFEKLRKAIDPLLLYATPPYVEIDRP
jgi:hypothetical protein